MDFPRRREMLQRVSCEGKGMKQCEVRAFIHTKALSHE
jgi:hypothetical protein